MNENSIKGHFYTFALLVADMRKKQKEYFKTRDRQVLIESKQLESKVDKVIESWENIIAKEKSDANTKL